MQGKICCILLFSLALCWGNESENADIYDATVRFSMELLQKIFDQESGNIIASPVSVHALLAMLQQGAGGNTKQQLDQVVHADEQVTREGYHNLTRNYQRSGRYNEIEFASRMFIKTGIEVLPQFIEFLVNDFQADIESLDFSEPQAVTHHINNWVAERTHNLIPELFEPDKIDSNSILVLVNAIFFKTYWDNPFLDIENKTFSSSPIEEIQVPTMHQQEYYQAGESTELGAKWLHLNFEGVNDFTLLLVLPNERHALNSLRQLTHEQWTNIFSHQDYKHVNVSIPKFNLETETELIPLLRSLGVEDLFGATADLSGISNQQIHVSEFLQKATIAVDEHGVTAAAATGAVANRRSKVRIPDAQEMEFKADQPFLVFIVHRPHAVPLFAGRVTNPLHK